MLSPPSPPQPVLFAQTRPRRLSTSWIWGLSCFTCGCLLIIVLGIGGVALVAASVVRASACSPSDFPDYPHSVWVYSTFVDSTCRVGRVTLDGSSSIFNFYKGALGEGHGDWTITAAYQDVYRIDFQRTRGKTLYGVLWVIDQARPRFICAEFNQEPHALSQVVTASSRRPVCFPPPQPTSARANQQAL